MPLPIKPVHSLDAHDELFEAQGLEESAMGLSALQAQFLGTRETTAKTKLSERTIAMLEMIDKSTDEVVTAAQTLAGALRNGDTLCRVPTSITDSELLSLKTSGLVQGHGRAVSLTDRARVSLRDHYLDNSVNEFRKNRSKSKFDLNAARAVKASNEADTSSRLRRVASTKFTRVSGRADLVFENYAYPEEESCPDCGGTMVLDGDAYCCPDCNYAILADDLPVRMPEPYVPDHMDD